MKTLLSGSILTALIFALVTAAIADDQGSPMENTSHTIFSGSVGSTPVISTTTFTVTTYGPYVHLWAFAPSMGGYTTINVYPAGVPSVENPLAYMYGINPDSSVLIPVTQAGVLYHKRIKYEDFGARNYYGAISQGTGGAQGSSATLALWYSLESNR